LKFGNCTENRVGVNFHTLQIDQEFYFF